MGSDIVITPLNKPVEKKARAAKPKNLENFNEKQEIKKTSPAEVKKKIEESRAKKSPSQIKSADYAKKLQKARLLYKKGNSIRSIADTLGMDRSSLAKNLALN